MTASRPVSLPPGWPIVALDVCGSTNDEARALARAGAPEGTLVWAQRQEAGRGRRGRSWQSPPGNLYLSILLRPGVEPAQAAPLSLLAAVAVREAVQDLTGAQAGLKWPNDVLLDGAKLAGILLETDPDEAGSPPALVLGIGVNVQHAPTGLPYPATCLWAVPGAGHPSVDATLSAVAHRCAAWYARWRQDGLAPIRAAWLAGAVGVGGPVTVTVADGPLSGIFQGLDGDGALLLDTPTGIRRVTAGDIVLGQGNGPGDGNKDHRAPVDDLGVN